MCLRCIECNEKLVVTGERVSVHVCKNLEGGGYHVHDDIIYKINGDDMRCFACRYSERRSRG